MKKFIAKVQEEILLTGGNAEVINYVCDLLIKENEIDSECYNIIIVDYWIDRAEEFRGFVVSIRYEVEKNQFGYDLEKTEERLKIGL